jgi:uncharacterized protein (DUF433 family)
MKPALPRGEFMAAEIIIIDRGRGKQLSTCRVTVQDVFPYVHKGYTDDEIRKAIPALTVAEIQFLRQYIADHLQEVADEDRRIRERNATLRNPPEVMEILHSARRERRARMAAKEPGSNGAHHPG